jgi:hypothetical protein
VCCYIADSGDAAMMVLEGDYVVVVAWRQQCDCEFAARVGGAHRAQQAEQTICMQSGSCC